MAKPSTFLLAVPAYREARRLRPFLPNLVQAVAREFPRSKIVLVDDGSGPAEIAALQPLLRQMQSRFPRNFQFLSLPQNLGKGGAILAAWKSAETGWDYLGFVDADGAFPPAEVIRLAKELVPGGRGPALFSSRVRMLGLSVQRKASRHYLGRLFATWVGLVLESGIYDSQSGLKFVPRKAFRKICPRLRGQRFAWDVELLGSLLSIRCAMREIPVEWRDVPGSKVHWLRDGAHLFWATLREGLRLRKIRRYPQAAIA